MQNAKCFPSRPPYTCVSRWSGAACTYMRLVCHACVLRYSTNAHTYIRIYMQQVVPRLDDYAEYIVHTCRRESASRVLRVVVVLRAVLHCMDRGTCLQHASWKQGVEPTYVRTQHGAKQDFFSKMNLSDSKQFWKSIKFLNKCVTQEGSL